MIEPYYVYMLWAIGNTRGWGWSEGWYRRQGKKWVKWFEW